MIWTLDTSALIRAYIPDGPVPANLREALAETDSGESAIVAPDLIIAEAGQVMNRKRRTGELSDEEAHELLDSIVNLPLRTLHHRELIVRALEIAREAELTVYDALYLATAERCGSRLITADDRLLRAASLRGLS